MIKKTIFRLIIEDITKPLRQTLLNVHDTLCQKQYELTGSYAFFYKGKTYIHSKTIIGNHSSIKPIHKNVIDDFEDYLTMETKTENDISKVYTWLSRHFHTTMNIHNLYWVTPESCHHILKELKLNKDKAKYQEVIYDEEVFSIINYSMLLAKLGT